MRCPSCHQPAYYPSESCPTCQFNGDTALVEELDHIKWALAEIDTWQTLGLEVQDRQLIHQRYATRHKELEVALGLRLPPFTLKEARNAWPELFQREALLQRMAEWLAAGIVKPAATQKMIEQASRQVEELLEQLDGHPRPAYPQTDSDRLNLVNFLLEAVDYLGQSQGFTSAAAPTEILDPLLAKKEQLEIKLGLRPINEPVTQPASQLANQPITKLAAEFDPRLLPSSPPSSIASPLPPLRERLWRTLLSERTLQALLFLGIFLLFAAALSFVVWGWKDFSAPLRVAIPSGFTALFFALGWYVRTKTPLYRSGIALSAIAALLIPIDFYTVYVNFHISTDYWPLFWLITSLVCLTAYIIVTLLIRSRFFSYLVGTAAGSVILAIIQIGHQAFGLSDDWRSAGLSSLALGLIILAAVLERSLNTAASPPRHLTSSALLFAEPFRYLSLLTVGVLMPLTFGWRFIDRATYDTLHYALTINWWLGGIIFGWGAVHYRSRSLGLLAAISLPVATYLMQAVIFNQIEANLAWHAFGWALLVPLYFMVGYKLLAYKDNLIVHGHGRTATGWGVALLIFAALWSLTDITNGLAAASSQLVLAAAVILAALLWHKPRLLYAASLLSLSATTFGVAELDLTLAQLGIGWASLAIIHIIIALYLDTGLPTFSTNLVASSKSNLTLPIVIAGYVIAALALLPALFPYDGSVLAYTLGNWLGLAAWGARLSHLKQSGFTFQGKFGKPIFHWLTALPLPLWLWLIFANLRPLDFSLPLSLAVLAWGMIALSYKVAQLNSVYCWPWYLTGLLVSIVAPVAAFIFAPDGFAPALTLLTIGFLYFADAITRRQFLELAPGGIVTAWGFLLLLNQLQLAFEAVSFALALLISSYILAGLQIERYKSPTFTRQFLAPLYLTAHILTLFVLVRIYMGPFNKILFDIPWTDVRQVWGAASQFLLATSYGLYAWGRYKERWGHLAIWLAVAGGAFLVVHYSRGQGSSAPTVALIAIILVLTERTLQWLQQPLGVRNGQPFAFTLGRPAFFRLTWRLFKRPLLITGWVVSAGAIGLALIRNLWWLGGARPQQIWAVIALLLITGLYVLSARLYRQARFIWLASFLVFAPWTILTNLGWFTVYRPTAPGFAVSWAILSWVLFLASLILNRFTTHSYALSLKTVSYLLLPFSLLWGVADVDTSRFTFALAIGLYGLAAIFDHHLLLKHSVHSLWIFGKTRFIYAALGLLPVWCIYLLAWLLPMAHHEHYGLLLLIFGPLGLITGQWLRQVAPKPELRQSYALPGYLMAYGTLIVGTMLVAHETPLLALALLFDAVLLLISAWLFRNPLWIYPAAALVPLSLLLALNEAEIVGGRQGWWLIGLASIYLALAWALRRSHLSAYGTATLTIGFALIALGLPPSSQDQTGALWGYGSAALLYTIAAFWLRQPLLLTPASALVLVPYVVGLQKLPIAVDYYGLALFPGAILALAIGWGLDHRFGKWQGFPWSDPGGWPMALTKRLLGWWGLPLYALGFGMATVSPLFTDFRAGLTALTLFLLIPLFGWAIYRFRLRVWLLALALAGHLAAIYYLQELGWWRYPAWAWYRFLPVTLITISVALFIEQWRGEGSPLRRGNLLKGWSRPLYIMALLDIIIGQISSLGGTGAGALVTLVHALTLAVLASLWLSGWMPYFSATLGSIALVEWLSTLTGPIEELPTALAGLALGYGLAGYGLTLVRFDLPKSRVLRAWLVIWELPFQRFSIVFSLGILVLTSWLSLDLAGWTIRAIVGLPFQQGVEFITVQMVVKVMALLGLLYVAASIIHRWLRLGYIAIGMLLASWMLQAFYIHQWENIQWYAIPAGLYLLLVAYLEWRRGRRVLARWLDYAAMLLMLGSLFWQTLLFGWGYALLLGVEGFAAFWWGSARRLRRFLYAGMGAVVLATAGQLINALSSINQWIVFGLIGLLLVMLAVLIERKLESIKAWHEVLESWE